MESDYLREFRKALIKALIDIRNNRRIRYKRKEVREIRKYAVLRILNNAWPNQTLSVLQIRARGKDVPYQDERFQSQG